MMQYPGLWPGLSSDRFSKPCVNMGTRNCILTPSCLARGLAQPTFPFSPLESALRVPGALHGDESHPEAPLLNLETIDQSRSEAEATSSLLQTQLTATEGKAKPLLFRCLCSQEKGPEPGNDPSIRR